MSYSEKCPCCGHKITAYQFKLNKGLVGALRKLTEFYIRNKRRAKLGELNLSTSQYANFPQLGYFGFSQRTSDGHFPTKRAFAFLNGQIAMPSHEITFKSEVVPTNHPARSEYQKPKMVFVDDVDPSYKQREEYQTEKGSSIPKLFNI